MHPARVDANSLVMAKPAPPLPLPASAAGRDPDALYAAALASQAAGRPADAEALYRTILALRPDVAEAHFGLGNALLVQGRADEAAGAYRRAIELRRDYVDAYNNLGGLLKLRGQLAEAEAAYRHAIDLVPGHAQALCNLGSVLSAQGRVDAAADAYREAIRLKPDFVDALMNLGELLSGQGELEAAAARLRQAITARPDLAEAHNALGKVLVAQGRSAEAEKSFERAIRLNPNLADAHNNLGVVLSDRGEPARSEASYRRAIAILPAYAEVHSNLGGLLQRQGRLAEAKTAFQTAIALKPDLAEPHYYLARLEAAAPGSAEAREMIARLERQVASLDRLPVKAREGFLFALGKALEDAGDVDRAFDCLVRANALHRAGLAYDVAAAEKRLASIATAFDRPTLDRLAGQGLADARPIFVVGMPRSGTTLIEQIISAHPQIQGGGELPNLDALAAKSRGHDGAPYPDFGPSMDGKDSRLIGQAYLDSLPNAEPGRLRLTDKWPYNFAHLGLIHACLPNAVIIHCRRDPRDVCLSCFGIRFEGGQDFAYDLAELGRYWRAYDRLMSHWREALPPGRMLEAPYEAVVGDVEDWARRLIDHVGLPWDDACLRFFESRHEVRTASAAQVRRPIYSASVGRWRPYAHHLAPLLAALGDGVAPYDKVKGRGELE